MADIKADMSLLRRHKYVITILAIYWPVLFIITHIPVPMLARRSGMSDKTMHFLAYLVLVFFWWFTISPYRRVKWHKAKVWMTLVIMVWYGVFDEWLQSRVGRSADVKDFFTDLIGTITGLIILTVLRFWTAGIVIYTILIIAVSNFSKIDLIWDLPFLNTGFHFLGYAGYTLIWIQHMYRRFPLKANRLTQPKWFLRALSLPIALLIVVKLSSISMGKDIWPIDCLTAIVGIISATLTSYFTCMAYAKDSA